MIDHIDPIVVSSPPPIDPVYDGSKPATRRKAAMSSPNPTHAEWAALLQRVREMQDETAFAQLFEYFAPRIKGFLVKSGADEQTAEEATQETMVAVWHKAHQFDPTRASVPTWIYTIARNKRINILRKSARPEPEDLPWGPEPDPTADETLTIQEETAQLTAALNDLPDQQRDIVTRAYYGDLSHTELAEETGLPLGTIKSRIRLGLKRLRQTLTDQTQ